MSAEPCGAQMDGCVASCVLPPDHVEHRDSDGDTWPVDPTGRPEWFHVPPGTEVLSYDPDQRYARLPL